MRFSQLPLADDLRASDYMLFETSSGPKKVLVKELMFKLFEGLPSVPIKRSFYRGKYLGDRVSAAQAEAIRSGTFDDLWAGDYWTIDNINWRIWDFDYWANYGYNAKSETRSHHVVIIPDQSLCTSPLYTGSDVTNLTYRNSTLRTSGVAQARTIIENSFTMQGSSLNLYYHNDTIDEAASVYTAVEVPSAEMLFGTDAAGHIGSAVTAVQPIEPSRQLALGALAPEYIYLDAANVSDHYFLRNQYHQGTFYIVGNTGYTIGVNQVGSKLMLNPNPIGEAGGVRPVFGICYVGEG